MSELENALKGKIIAILVANGFEESHMTSLHKGLIATGAEVKIVSPEKGVVNSWHDTGWGHFFPANAFLPTSMSHHFDAVVIPGGSRHVSRLTSDPQTARFMRGFMEDSKPVALFEDAVKILSDTGLLAERTVVADEASADSIREKGATVAEGDLHVDEMLVTAKVEIDAMIHKFGECIVSYEPEVWEAA